MDYNHYVVSNRLIKEVSGTGTQNQYWYSSVGGAAGDKASTYMRCGRYLDLNGNLDLPFFFAPGNEDGDYTAATGGYAQSRFGSKEMLSTLFGELEAAQKNLLIFHFGYENSKEKEMTHLEFLHKRYVTATDSKLGRVLMVTWPSQGFGGYNNELGDAGNANDDSDVTVTAHALAVFLLKFKHFVEERYQNAPPTQFRPKIHLVVQSMANAILERCCARLKTLNENQKLDQFFSRIMLTSPDIADNLFDTSAAFPLVANMAERVYVVHSPQDWILGTADKFHKIKGAKRMGVKGPVNMNTLPANIYRLQVTQKKKKMIPIDFNHRYFEYNDAVIEKYLAIFKGEDQHFSRESEVKG